MLLGSTYSDNNDPLSAMCVKTDMGFQTVSSTLIALPSFQPKMGSAKPSTNLPMAHQTRQVLWKWTFEFCICSLNY